MPVSVNDYSRYMPEIDVADGLSRIMNNKKLYLSLLKRFKARQMIEGLVQKINENEGAEQVSYNAHAVKGAAGNLGLTQLYQIALDVETSAKNGEDCSPQVNRLNQILESTEQALERLFKDESV